MTEAALRLDKWLWHARFFKTRSLATKAVAAGHIRVNGQKTSKPATRVGPGDVLTFAQGHWVRVVEILACGLRRGPASEAQLLYQDRSGPRPPRPVAAAKAPGYDGKGRPSKKDRRSLDVSRSRPLE